MHPIPDILDELRGGRMVVLVDDERREGRPYRLFARARSIRPPAQEPRAASRESLPYRRRGAGPDGPPSRYNAAIAMTAILQKAIDELSKRPEAEQEAIAALILEELADEDRWQAKFAATQDKLAKLAEEALTEYRAGRSLPLDFDRQ